MADGVSRPVQRCCSILGRRIKQARTLPATNDDESVLSGLIESAIQSDKDTTDNLEFAEKVRANVGSGLFQNTT